jgi:hypothetical protein
VNTNETTPIMPVARKNGDVGVGLDTVTPIVDLEAWLEVLFPGGRVP